jgi:hypothetical protein
MPKRLNCVHTDSPFANLATACNKQASPEKRHGFLCSNHYKMLDTQTDANLRRPGNQHRDLEAELIAGIIASEQRAINFGERYSVRFGAIEPEYLHFWRPR